MSELIDGAFATILLLPGFLSIFLPYRIIARKLRYTTFELTLISLVFSIGIFGLTFKTYQFLSNSWSELFEEKIQISTISLSQLFDNNGFLTLLFLYTIGFILLGFYFIPKDRFVRLRAYLTNNPERQSDTTSKVWDGILDKHEGYAVIETNDEKLIVGFIESYSDNQEKKEILLKYPENYNIDRQTSTPIPNIQYIFFRDDDIKRIYFMSRTES